MPRQTKLVEIDLRSGITTNDPLTTIGPKLWHSTNSIWGYRYPRYASIGTTQAYSLRQPTTFPKRDGFIAEDTRSFRDLGFCRNVVSGIYTLFMGANITNQYHYWTSELGAFQEDLFFNDTVERSYIPDNTKTLGCSTYWHNPGFYPWHQVTDVDLPNLPVTDPDTGIFVFSHAEAFVPDTDFGHVYYLMDDADALSGTNGNDPLIVPGPGVRSLTTDVENCPKGCAALTTYLDRLWLLTAPIHPYTVGSELWYTDPLNVSMIRSENVIKIPDRGTCLIPAQFGELDSSGVPHLVIGCAERVSVLDGDPILGGGLQADLRTISMGVGILNPRAAALTNFGVFLLGTDGDLWLIPPGAQTMVPTGAPIRNHLGVNNLQNTLDVTPNAIGSLVWLAPYLYIYPGGESGAFYIAEPSTNDIKFWGPMTWTDGAVREVVVRATDDNYNYHSVHDDRIPSVHSIDTLPYQGSPNKFRYLVFDSTTLSEGSYPEGSSVGRQPSVESGLISIPGHRVQAQRVFLETLRMPAIAATDEAVVWQVAVADEKGNVVNAIHNPNEVVMPGTHLQTETAFQQWVVPPLPASRAVRVTVWAAEDAHLDLMRLLVEIHMTPASF